jgi:hypothetical protein
VQFFLILAQFLLKIEAIFGLVRLRLHRRPPHAVANPPQILARLRLAKDKQVLVHDQVKLVAAGFAGPAAGVFAVALGMEK